MSPQSITLVWVGISWCVIRLFKNMRVDVCLGMRGSVSQQTRLGNPVLRMDPIDSWSILIESIKARPRRQRRRSSSKDDIRRTSPPPQLSCSRPYTKCITSLPTCTRSFISTLPLLVFLARAGRTETDSRANPLFSRGFGQVEWTQTPLHPLYCGYVTVVSPHTCYGSRSCYLVWKCLEPNTSLFSNCTWGSSHEKAL